MKSLKIVFFCSDTDSSDFLCKLYEQVRLNSYNSRAAVARKMVHHWRLREYALGSYAGPRQAGSARTV